MIVFCTQGGETFCKISGSVSPGKAYIALLNKYKSNVPIGIASTMDISAPLYRSLIRMWGANTIIFVTVLINTR
ncbi:hypothetical protein D3C85_1735300 [compost metagenome]